MCILTINNMFVNILYEMYLGGPEGSFMSTDKIVTICLSANLLLYSST